jgi:hypothetical protein
MTRGDKIKVKRRDKACIIAIVIWMVARSGTKRVVKSLDSSLTMCGCRDRQIAAQVSVSQPAMHLAVATCIAEAITY